MVKQSREVCPATRIRLFRGPGKSDESRQLYVQIKRRGLKLRTHENVTEASMQRLDRAINALSYAGLLGDPPVDIGMGRFYLRVTLVLNGGYQDGLLLLVGRKAYLLYPN